MPETLRLRSSDQLTSTVWRAVEEVPPTERDFYSYAALGRQIPGVDYLRLTAVSMFLTEDLLHAAQRRYPDLPPWRVELDLRRDPLIRYALTNKRTGHLDVWAPADALLACLVDG